MHPLCCTLLLPHVPARVARGALVAHIGTGLRHLAVELLSKAGPLCSSQMSLWNDLDDPVFDGVGLSGF